MDHQPVAARRELSDQPGQVCHHLHFFHMSTEHMARSSRLRAAAHAAQRFASSVRLLVAARVHGHFCVYSRSVRHLAERRVQKNKTIEKE